MTFQGFHNDFKILGKSFLSVQELLDFSKNVEAKIYEFLIEWFDHEEFVKVKTSGSTGTPKIIKLQKKQLKNSAQLTGAYFGLGAKTTAFLCMSASYIAGKMMLVRAMELGWHLDVVEPCSNPLKETQKFYDFCAMVPYQLHHSLEDLHKVDTLIVGGGAVSNDLLHKIQSLKTHIYATYGMTETITHIALKKLNHLGQQESFYKALPSVEISKDDRGCLVIKAPKISDEQIITNDLVRLVSEFEFEWLGRVDNVINSGGIKHIPEQIEKKLAKVIKNRFFIAGLPDERLNEKIVLVIEGEKKDSVMNEFKNFNKLNRYERPKEIYFVDQFIETPTSKINRSKTISNIKKK